MPSTSTPLKQPLIEAELPREGRNPLEDWTPDELEALRTDLEHIDEEETVDGEEAFAELWEQHYRLTAQRRP